jgi:hypothetical protein
MEDRERTAETGDNVVEIDNRCCRLGVEDKRRFDISPVEIKMSPAGDYETRTPNPAEIRDGKGSQALIHVSLSPLSKVSYGAHVSMGIFMIRPHLVSGSRYWTRSSEYNTM